MFIEKTKNYNRMDKAAVTAHVDNTKSLDDSGKLVLCGPFKGYPGVAGMVVMRTDATNRPTRYVKQNYLSPAVTLPIR